MLKDGTLFLIPHEVAGLPVFGFGWALILWSIFGLGLITWLVIQQGWNSDTRSYLPILVIVAAAIYFVLPRVEEHYQGQPIGLAIRGYGTMMLLGVVLGVGLAVREARRMGIDPELVFSLAFWMFIAGISGARATYVYLQWDRIRAPTVGQTLINIVNVPDGGLVVYGAFVLALAVAIWFLMSNRMPLLAFGDLITPAMLLGLCLGRLGCLMTGCCYGGVCQSDHYSISFPENSPPYLKQVELGQFHGIRLAERTEQAETFLYVAEVYPDSAAAESGIKVGARVQSINGVTIGSAEELASNIGLMRNPRLNVETDQGLAKINIEALPARSLPVYPTQIYSSINAAILCLLLWAYYPIRRRDGEVIALLLTLYPITRFLLEWIRNDEPVRWGTSLTVSQLVSVGVIATAMGLWAYLQTQPRGSALPLSQS